MTFTQPPSPQAVLIVGFGGPERREDVIPFLENVLRGKRVPRSRMEAVAEHYYQFDGISPINQQVRDLIEALKPELAGRGIDLPVYWGNRNWHPLLPKTFRDMAADGIQHVQAIVLSAFGSYSGCRQYLENLEAARLEAGPGAPTYEKARLFYNHPEFIAANAERIREAIDSNDPPGIAGAHLAFTAHSIPRAMADACSYKQQLLETCRLIAEDLGIGRGRWELVYQSRSGRPTDPWLEPDINDYLESIQKRGIEDVIAHPIGFLSDNMEVQFDLDTEACETAEGLGLRMVRSSTVGTHQRFLRCLGDLVDERFTGKSWRTVGRFGPSAPCDPDCCKYPASQGAGRP